MQIYHTRSHLNLLYLIIAHVNVSSTVSDSRRCRTLNVFPFQFITRVPVSTTIYHTRVFVHSNKLHEFQFPQECLTRSSMSTSMYHKVFSVYASALQFTFTRVRKHVIACDILYLTRSRACYLFIRTHMSYTLVSVKSNVSNCHKYVRQCITRY